MNNAHSFTTSLFSLSYPPSSCSHSLLPALPREAEMPLLTTSSLLSPSSFLSLPLCSQHTLRNSLLLTAAAALLCRHPSIISLPLFFSSFLAECGFVQVDMPMCPVAGGTARKVLIDFLMMKVKSLFPIMYIPRRFTALKGFPMSSIFMCSVDNVLSHGSLSD